MKTRNVISRHGIAAFALREVTLRVGVFFDGTGNNRINSQIGNDCLIRFAGLRHLDECGGRCSDPVSSYYNDLTNIAHLAGCYRQQRRAANTGDGLQVFRAIYVSGVGTRSGGRDCTLSGMGFGRGSTGILAKVSRAVRKFERVLREFAADNPDCFVGKVHLDLFGFSRGAAAARHLANDVLLGQAGEIGTVMARQRSVLAPGFSLRHGDLRTRVVGLFDTVAAVGSLHDLGNVRDARNRDVSLYLPPGSADQVLHLVAADERRRNFALTSIRPGWTREIEVPGAHSDIGGGYRLCMREELLLSRPRHSVVSLATAVERSAAWDEAESEMAKFAACRWVDIDDPGARLGVRWASHRTRSMPGMHRVSVAVGLERQVRGHLSRVYLRLMHTLACEEGVPFEPLAVDKDLSITAELEPVAEKLMRYARGGVVTLEEREIALLYSRYIHCSAHWNDLAGRPLPKGSPLYVHAPCVASRVIHANEPQGRGKYTAAATDRRVLSET